MVTQHHKYAKNHWTAHFKENYIKFKVYLNKAVQDILNISKNYFITSFFKKFEPTNKPSGL